MSQSEYTPFALVSVETRAGVLELFIVMVSKRGALRALRFTRMPPHSRECRFLLHSKPFVPFSQQPLFSYLVNTSFQFFIAVICSKPR